MISKIKHKNDSKKNIYLCVFASIYSIDFNIIIISM